MRFTGGDQPPVFGDWFATILVLAEGSIRHERRELVAQVVVYIRGAEMDFTTSVEPILLQFMKIGNKAWFAEQGNRLPLLVKGSEEEKVLIGRKMPRPRLKVGTATEGISHSC